MLRTRISGNPTIFWEARKLLLSDFSYQSPIAQLPRNPYADPAAWIEQSPNACRSDLQSKW